MRHRSLAVVIAVHDSGIRWRAADVEGDLRKKFYLNRGELPAPICATPPPAGHDPATATATASSTRPTTTPTRA